MREVRIADTRRFQVTSYGNGWAYTFRCKPKAASIWFQDSDATVFRDEWNSMEENAPDLSLDQILGELWSEYGCLAKSDGED